MIREKQTALRYLSSCTGKNKIGIFILTFVQMLLGMSSVCFAMLLRGALDGATAKSQKTFFAYFIFAVLLVICQISLRAVVRFLEENCRSSIENTMKGRLFSCLLKKDYAQVTAVHSGEWMNRLTSDTAVAANGIVEIIPNLAGMSVKLVGALIMILVMEMRFIFILVPGGILMILFTYAFRKVLKRLHKNVQEADGALRVFLQERMGSLMIIRSFVAEESVSEKAQEKMGLHKNARMRKNHFSNFCNIGFATAMNGMYLLGFGYCGYGILNGTISYGTLLAILQLISQIQAPFANITGYLPRFYAMTASAERLMEAENYEDDSQEFIEKDDIGKFYEKRFSKIDLEHIYFSYPNREFIEGESLKGALKEPLKKSLKESLRESSSREKSLAQEPPLVLNDINLTIQKGDYVAFTGHSGCGKSTVLKLLLCLYPLKEGQIYLKTLEKEARAKQLEKPEKIEVEKIEESIPLESRWRRLFAYIPQGNQLLNGTIREIITFSDRSDRLSESDKLDKKQGKKMESLEQRKTDEKVEREIDEKADKKIDEKIYYALKIACAQEFISKLPDGIDTVLGERGAGLSEGQMQRIAIARAIYADCPILLLDEATSALDDETEKQLLVNLKNMTDKTVLIVTHRPAALSICNKVINFESQNKQ